MKTELTGILGRKVRFVPGEGYRNLYGFAGQIGTVTQIELRGKLAVFNVKFPEELRRTSVSGVWTYAKNLELA